MLNKISSFLTDSRRFASTTWLFRRGIYCFILWHTLINLPVASQIWSPGAHITPFDFHGNFFTDIVCLLSKESVAPYYWVFIALQLFFLTLGFWGISQRFIALMSYLLFINLHYKAVAIGTGGHYLVGMMLIYLVFMDETKPEEFSASQPVNRLGLSLNLLSNLAFIAAQIQLAVMYVFTSVNKLRGEKWIRGEALYDVLSISQYSHPWIQEQLNGSGTLLIAGNYFALLFQLFFPLLIWFKQTRLWILIAGLFFHSAIGLMTGIVDYSIAVLICYTLFIPEHISNKCRNFPIIRLLSRPLSRSK